MSKFRVPPGGDRSAVLPLPDPLQRCPECNAFLEVYAPRTKTDRWAREITCGVCGWSGTVDAAHSAGLDRRSERKGDGR